MNYNILYPPFIDHDEPPHDPNGWIKTPTGVPSPHLFIQHPDILILTFGYSIEFAANADMSHIHHAHSDVHLVRFHAGLNGHPSLLGIISLPRALDRLTHPIHLLPFNTLAPIADQIGPKDAAYWHHVLAPVVPALLDFPVSFKQSLQAELCSRLPGDVCLCKETLGDLLMHPQKEVRLTAAKRLGTQEFFPEPL